MLMPYYKDGPVSTLLKKPPILLYCEDVDIVTFRHHHLTNIVFNGEVNFPDEFVDGTKVFAHEQIR